MPWSSSEPYHEPVNPEHPFLNGPSSAPGTGVWFDCWLFFQGVDSITDLQGTAIACPPRRVRAQQPLRPADRRRSRSPARSQELQLLLFNENTEQSPSEWPKSDAGSCDVDQKSVSGASLLCRLPGPGWHHGRLNPLHRFPRTQPSRSRKGPNSLALGPGERWSYPRLSSF